MWHKVDWNEEACLQYKSQNKASFTYRQLGAWISGDLHSAYLWVTGKMLMGLIFNT